MILIELLKSFKWSFVNKINQRWLNESEEIYCKELRKWFGKCTGQSLDLANPKSFNEKIQWLKLYDSTEEKARLADKLEVRSWVGNKIGEEYLIPIIASWNSVNDINFNDLPDQFVLKTNHGSSTNILVKEKSKLNIWETKLKLNRWLHTNYALKMGFELHYGLISPKILCEQFMGDNLIDYKLFCFNGKPEFFWVDTERFADHKRNTYDLEWKELPFVIDKFQRCNVEKPKNLRKMIQFATILAEGFSFVRVDFYEINSKLYFGEMTFTSCSGRSEFYPSEYDTIYGEKIILPIKKELPIKAMEKIWRK